MTPRESPSSRGDIGLAHRFEIPELRRHLLHEQPHRARALLPGCPVLAGHDQQRAESAGGFIEFAQLAGDRIRIAEKIDAGLGELVEGHGIAREWHVVAGFYDLDEPAFHLEAELVGDEGTQIVHCLGPGICEIDVARHGDLIERPFSSGGLCCPRIAVGLPANEGRGLELRREQRVAALARELDHGLGVGRGRHRHMRLVQRTRRGNDALAAPIFPVPVERLLRAPAFQDQIEGLPQARMTVFVRETALAREQRIGKSGAEAEDEPAVAHHVIGHRRLDRGIDGVGKMNELHRRAHANALGQPCRLAHQQLRHGQGVDLVHIERLAMMLADIGGRESRADRPARSRKCPPRRSATRWCADRKPLEKMPNSITIPQCRTRHLKDRVPV